jgi:hypothetical protein
MASQTVLGERRRISLRLMHIVAGEAGQLGGGLITSAQLQKAHLISVDVYRGVWIVLFAAIVIVERLSRYVGKRSCPWVPAAAVTLCANFHLALSN